MNPLQKFIADRKLDEVECVNFLQLQGIISDNAILAEDVANGDCAEACQVLLLLD